MGGFDATIRVRAGTLKNYASAGGALDWLGQGSFIKKLPAGQPIAHAVSNVFGVAHYLRVGFTASVPNNSPLGSFASGKTGLAGFKLPNGDLGWMRVEVIDRNGDGVPDEVEAIDWAYNNAAGTSIKAGDTGQVPEPSALGLLAIGSAGVLAWRRRRSADPVSSTK